MTIMQPSLLAVLFIMLFAAHSTSLAEPESAIEPDNKNLHVRSGLGNLSKRIEVDKNCHVAFLGGSITQNGGGHVAMVPAWLKGEFPGCEFKVTNAGLSSTCSTSGAFRLASQVFGGDPVDLLIVEFAVNDDQDAMHAERECIRGMEGIVRHVRRDHPQCEIVMVHFVNPGMLAKALRGETPVSIAAHECVATRYDVISVNVAAELADAVATKRYTWKDYGGTHPGKFGYRVASNMITAAIQAGLEKKNGETRAERKLPNPSDASSYDKGKFVPPDKAKFGDDWQLGKVSRALLPVGSIRSDYKKHDVLRSDQAGAELEFEFAGRSIGAFVLAGPDAGIIETSIDGSAFEKHDLFHRFSGGLNYPRSVVFNSGLKQGKHVLRLRISAEKNPKSKGHTASILFFEVNES